MKQRIHKKELMCYHSMCIKIKKEENNIIWWSNYSTKRITKCKNEITLRTRRAVSSGRWEITVDETKSVSGVPIMADTSAHAFFSKAPILVNSYSLHRPGMFQAFALAPPPWIEHASFRHLLANFTPFSFCFSSRRPTGGLILQCAPHTQQLPWSFLPALLFPSSITCKDPIQFTFITLTIHFTLCFSPIEWEGIAISPVHRCIARLYIQQMLNKKIIEDLWPSVLVIVTTENAFLSVV